MGLTKHRTYPTPSLICERIRSKCELFQKARSLDISVTHCRDSSPVCLLEHTHTHRGFKLFWPHSFSLAGQLASSEAVTAWMSTEAVSAAGHCGERPSAKPISLSEHHKNRQSRENFPGSDSTWGFFSNTTIWSDGRFKKKKGGKRVKVKPNLPTSKIFALLRKTKVIWSPFESIFWWHTSRRRAEGAVEQTHNLSLTGKLPNED